MTDIEPGAISLDSVFVGAKKQPEALRKPFYQRIGVSELCAHNVPVEDDCLDCEKLYLKEEIERHETFIEYLTNRLRNLP